MGRTRSSKAVRRSYFARQQSQSRGSRRVRRRATPPSLQENLTRALNLTLQLYVQNREVQRDNTFLCLCGEVQRQERQQQQQQQERQQQQQQQQLQQQQQQLQQQQQQIQQLQQQQQRQLQQPQQQQQIQQLQ